MALPRRRHGPEGPRLAQIRRSVSTVRRRLGPPLAGVVALLALPAVAAGQSIAITPPSDMVADKIQTVVVSGDAGPSGSRVYLHATTAASCAATYDQGTDQAQVFSNGNYFSNSFSQTMQVSPYGAGPLLLCAYLTALPSSTPSATDQTTVAVREPSGSMQLAVDPNPPIQEQQYKITVSGTAERDTTAVRVISLDNGQACAATPDANGNGLQVHDLTGRQQRPADLRQPVLGDRARYAVLRPAGRACAPTWSRSAARTSTRSPSCSSRSVASRPACPSRATAARTSSARTAR